MGKVHRGDHFRNIIISLKPLICKVVLERPSCALVDHQHIQVLMVYKCYAHVNCIGRGGGNWGLTIYNKPSNPARFYLLPMIHKLRNPGWPFVSSCNSLTEKISKFVNEPLCSGEEDPLLYQEHN